MVDAAQEGTLLTERPDARYAVPDGLEKEVLAVRSPVPAAFGVRGVPAGEQFVKTGPIGIDLPQRQRDRLWIPQGETQPPSVRRRAQPECARGQPHEIA